MGERGREYYARTSSQPCWPKGSNKRFSGLVKEKNFDG